MPPKDKAKPTLVLISKEKRAKLKETLKEMFTNTNHEGYAEAVIHAIEFVLLEIFADKPKSAAQSDAEKKLEQDLQDPEE